MSLTVFAHRGASGYEPENTLKAFATALEQGATSFELDVYNVEDQLVVFHDENLKRLTEIDKAIADTSLNELSGLTVRGERIPTLIDVLALLKGCEVNIELKGPNTYQPLIDLYPSLEQEFGFTPSELLISSFDHQALLQVRQALPNVRIAPLYHEFPDTFNQVIDALQPDAIHVSLNMLKQNPKKLEQLQAITKVHVFTVNEKDDINTVLDLGLAGIFCDYPDKALEWIKAYAETTTVDGR
ncbi:glycerophosphodiester phosphodiesterase [Parashewanella curva]|uniref:Glycerophosphodiester phosphodiesterase n=1 Tax=Parashewanella curva TaxID=2338552 RepID=A0A3L8PVD6_9GAMM|nr:glycerophosphodiester phosphodiesterase family protein [Parashewanella curva]RLV58543.1 glycerophosphodiester phosphodiesterase [Parashewanella curva]